MSILTGVRRARHEADLQRAPDHKHVVANWDFTVEND
jgi:hypothetical protein